MKLWTLHTLWIVLVLILSGCVSAPVPNDKSKVDETLPIITLTQNGIILDIKSIAFEWESIKDTRVEGIHIYKKSPTRKDEVSELKYYKSIENRFATHYVDTQVEPDTKYSYAFQTYSSDFISNHSRMFDVNSKPVLDSVSWIHSITGMPQTAKIIWRPHGNEKVKSYIIERKTLEAEKWEELANIDGRLNAEYIDVNLQDNYVYKYRIRVRTFDDIISTASKIVKVVTKALPHSITNIKTTTTLPRKIDITWDASTQKDFALYYLYRSSKVDGHYDLIATLHNNSYEDIIEEDGKSYFYRVSAVDKDGLESEHEKDSMPGMTLSKPSAPTITQTKLLGSNIEVTWKQTDPRTKSYILRRGYQKGWFDKKIDNIEGIVSNKFIDKNVLAGSTYTYVVLSVDEFNIVSDDSIEAKIVTPESKIIEEAKIVEPQEEVEVENATPIKVLEKKEEPKVEMLMSPTQDLDLSGL